MLNVLDMRSFKEIIEISTYGKIWDPIIANFTKKCLVGGKRYSLAYNSYFFHLFIFLITSKYDNSAVWPETIQRSSHFARAKYLNIYVFFPVSDLSRVSKMREYQRWKSTLPFPNARNPITSNFIFFWCSL